MIYTHEYGGDATRRARTAALLAASLAILAACHTPTTRVTAPDRALPPPDTHPLDDGTYDWHGLLIAPFGSVLKDIPMALHEVLLFRDEAHGSAAADDAECYAGDSPAPRFIGRTPDEYLLCFKQDRLSRIQASVRLSEAQAPAVFAAACADWLKNAAPELTKDGACEGHDGAIRFNGRLERESGQTETDLSIILDSSPDP
jgi:hypothetical protein